MTVEPVTLPGSNSARTAAGPSMASRGTAHRRSWVRHSPGRLASQSAGTPAGSTGGAPACSACTSAAAMGRRKVQATNSVCTSQRSTSPGSWAR